MPKLTKFHDFAAALPLTVLYVVWIAGLVSKLISESAGLTNPFTAVIALDVVYELATIVFLGLVVTLLVFRRPPENRAKGALPRVAAIVGANLQLLSLALPRVENSLPVLAASTIVTVIGLAGSIYVAGFLGRSFSILPQARGLVTAGPYRFVRHPLYLAEQTAVFGIMWQYAQPWGFAISLASIAAQFMRMHYEEKVLAETYPAYRAYMARTGRFIPRAFPKGSMPGGSLARSTAIDLSGGLPLAES